MSLQIEKNEEVGTSEVNVKTIGGMVYLDDKAITMEDFSTMVRYVMQNSDLANDDPRLELLADLKALTVSEGYNQGGMRLVLKGMDVESPTSQNVN